MKMSVFLSRQRGPLYTLLGDIFIENKTKVLGMYGAIGGAGLAAGPILGAIITTYMSWRTIFLSMFQFV